MANGTKQLTQVQQRYIHNRARVLAAISKLQTKLNEWDKDLETEKVHWGHVGSVAHIADNLEELAR